MAITEDRLGSVEELQKLWESSPETDAIEPYEIDTLTPRPRSNFSKWAAATALGWTVIFGALVVFQPEPSNPEAAIPLWADLLFAAFFLALFATSAGLLYRARWGFGASIAAAGTGALLALGCVATSHHPGAWWAYELGGFAFLGALSAAAYGKARKPS